MNKFCKEYLFLIALLLIVTFLPACSSFEVVTEDDKIQQLIKTVPADVEVKFVDKSYFKGLLANANGFYNQGSKTIYTVYNACVLEHEIYQAKYGSGHDHFPQRLMGCKALIK